MFCSRCGKEAIGEAAFCPSCGAPQVAQTPPTKKKRRWLLPAIAGGLVLVVALAGIMAFALGLGKPLGSMADPLTGTWGVNLKTDARDEPFSMEVHVRQDGSFEILGELAGMAGLADAFSHGTWSLVEEKDGYRSYDVRFEEEGGYRARIPASGLVGTWELALGDERLAVTFSEEGFCEIDALGVGNTGSWTQLGAEDGAANLVLEFQAYGAVCSIGHAQNADAGSAGTAGNEGESIDDAASAKSSSSQLVDFQSAASCNATCHTPMEPYVATAAQEAGSPGTDKWGNPVANTMSMLCVSHKAHGYDCLSCHQLTEAETGSLASTWATGNYVYPLEERDLDQLVGSRGLEFDKFCLNEACHNLTRADLTSATSDMSVNPHSDQHGEMDCGTCHKAHRASVSYCTTCHDDAEVPEGWLSASEVAGLESY